MNTYQTFWEEMEAEARAHNRTANEIGMLRTGYYSGATISMVLMRRWGLKLIKGDLSPEAAAELMRTLEEEIVAYFGPMLERQKNDSPK